MNRPTPPMLSVDLQSLPCIILAGGKSQRLRVNGQYKWALPFANKPSLLQHCIDRIKAQNNLLMISAPKKTASNQEIINGLSTYGLPLIHDQLDDFQGPLAALLSCLSWAKQQGQPWIATLPCDTPFFPEDIFKRLHMARPDQAMAAVPCYKNRMHPVLGLWSTTLYADLKKVVIEKKQRGLVKWAQTVAHKVEFAETETNIYQQDPFANINTLQDYQHVNQHWPSQ